MARPRLPSIHPVPLELRQGSAHRSRTALRAKTRPHYGPTRPHLDPTRPTYTCPGPFRSKNSSHSPTYNYCESHQFVFNLQFNNLHWSMTVQVPWNPGSYNNKSPNVLVPQFQREMLYPEQFFNLQSNLKGFVLSGCDLCRCKGREN